MSDKAAAGAEILYNDKWLAETTFRNLVRFYKAELHRIIRGAPARSLMSYPKLRRLRNDGVLVYCRGSPKGSRPSRYVLTARARAVLDNLE